MKESSIKTVRLESVDSTNSEAKRIFLSGGDDELLVIADEQTAGRGRMGRSFYSPKSTGLYMSYMFCPEKISGDTVLLTVAAAVAVSKAIEKNTGTVCGIKWVNDIMLGNKKVAGILCESAKRADGKTGIIVGVGINLSTECFPEEIKDTAVSLGLKTECGQLAADMVSEFKKIVSRLPDRDFLSYYRERSTVIGKDIVYIIQNEKRYGKAIGIDDLGGLIVENADGGTVTLNSGEITVRNA